MQLKRVVLGLALACGAALSPAQAADYVRGPATYRSVPVPAPIPVPETFRWYVRADIGIGLGQEPSINERGLVYGEDTPFDAVTPFGMSSTWFNGDFDTFFIGGVGAGIYLTPRFRADVTVDARTKADVTANQTGAYAALPAPNTVLFNTQDKTEVRAVVTLANLYWDLSQRGSGITPYVGAGFGFAVRSMDRMNETTEVLVDGVGNPLAARTWGGQDKAHQVAPAAAVMAGLSYDISPGTILDVNYRFMWMGGVDMSTRINGYNSRLNIGDSIDHQIRAGLRWNVW